MDGWVGHSVHLSDLDCPCLLMFVVLGQACHAWPSTYIGGSLIGLMALSRGATSSTVLFHPLLLPPFIHPCTGWIGRTLYPFVWLNCSCLLCRAWDTWPSFCREPCFEFLVKGSYISSFVFSLILGAFSSSICVCCRVDGWMDGWTMHFIHPLELDCLCLLRSLGHMTLKLLRSLGFV